MTEKGMEEKIEAVAELIVQSHRIVIFTGAGVSTESGIPDFRSPGGIWTKYDPDDFTIQSYVSDKNVRKKVWRLMIDPDMMFGCAEPNPGHYAINELEAMGKLYAIVTQNVDGLHQKAGTPPELVFELHGDMSHGRCMSCGAHYPSERIIEWLEQGLDDPPCEKCGGMLKPAGVFFGEQLPMDVLTEAERRSRACDLCIVMGSSLVVTPAATLPYYAARSNAKLVIINIGSTALDGMAAIRIEGKSGEVMPRIMDIVKRKLAA
jgi:NAD-dependent deacetylase